VSRAVVVQVSRYLSVKFFVSLATGICVTIGLWLLGMDFPLLWGAVSFVLNFIPNIGSIGAGVGVGIFALVQFWPAFWPIFLACFIMLAVNMTIGNFLEPRIQGQNLGLSPFVIVVSLLLWGWLWGFAGLVLAVPMTVIMKIVCENVPVLEPVAIIIGSYREVKERKRQEKAAQD
jgi:predicted PurR-regulated permease PerM